MSWLQDPAALVATWPVMALPFLVALAAFLKYVVPPFPGDSLMLLGFFLSAHGGSPQWTIVAGACFGGLFGAALAFYLGRRLGMPILLQGSSSAAPRRRSTSCAGSSAPSAKRRCCSTASCPSCAASCFTPPAPPACEAGPAIFWSACSNLVFALVLAADRPQRLGLVARDRGPLPASRPRRRLLRPRPPGPGARRPRPPAPPRRRLRPALPSEPNTWRTARSLDN